MKEDLKKIINHYGIMPQLKYLQSEVFELNEAVIKHQNKNPIILALDSIQKMAHSLSKQEYEISSINDIAGEIADVMVMVKQIQYVYDISDEKIQSIMESKVNRQLERIANENNK